MSEHTGSRKETDRFDGKEAALWQWSLCTLLFVLATILALYRETVGAMITIWARSETFTHGFLILPISLWLIWRMRHSLIGLVPRANIWMLPLIGMAGVAWLLGEMAAVGVLSQFAVVVMVVLAAPAILGLTIAREMVFPLGFLFFAVPFGEFFMPQLMQWTADMTILGLRWSGIPVYQEGLSFVIPSGNWSVVEACSGVRYLIASLVVGTLFAYLNYHSLKRRLIFVGVSLVVPIAANWIRAYMIVMLGHLSGNKLAAGVDHLIYGWLFFGFVIMILFWIGARWREDVRNAEAIGFAVDRPSFAVSSRGLNFLAAGLAVLVFVSPWPLVEWMGRRNVPADISVVHEIEESPGWTGSRENFVGLMPRYENASANLTRTFTRNGQKVGLVIAYYRNQGEHRKMISSDNVLVTSRDEHWRHIASDSRKIVVDGQSQDVRTTELWGKTDSSRLMVWQWYWINGRLTSSDYLAKAYTAFYRLFGQGDDSAAIVVYTAMRDNDIGAAEALLQEFVEAQGVAIGRALQKTRDSHD